jgi:hypothetical protein
MPCNKIIKQELGPRLMSTLGCLYDQPPGAAESTLSLLDHEARWRLVALNIIKPTLSGVEYELEITPLGEDVIRDCAIELRRGELERRRNAALAELERALAELERAGREQHQQERPEATGTSVDPMPQPPPAPGGSQVFERPFNYVPAEEDEHRTDAHTGRTVIYVAGDQYISGQAGAVGPGSAAQNMSFVQTWNQISGEGGSEALAGELTRLIEHLRSDRSEQGHDIAIGVLTEAQLEAQQGNGPGAIERLSRLTQFASAGKWALSAATAIGTGVAAGALQSVL